ncbi:MAG: hypothetical protein K0S44_2163 [Bacteroidetes bacterium]|jgi:hypothetical protein|nr:hypothetical protein [Bacteroidota bacterium]
MKKTLLAFLFFIGLTVTYGQKNPPEYTNLVKRADSLFQLKDYKNSALTYSSAFKTLGWKGQETDRYNAARAWALINNADSAFFNLQRIADKLYYAQYEQISNDEDLKSLHSDKRWQPLLGQIRHNKLPTGWFRAGSKPASYKMILDSLADNEKRKVLTIQSVDKNINGFGTLMQDFSPEKYRGKRIRMTGYMKSKDVEKRAGFWLRIDGPENSKKSLAFDNMHDRAVIGTTEWKKYEIVLDVAPSATNIAFGALLTGTGQIWFEKFTFEVVNKSVPTTPNKKPTEPNLDFNK